MEKNRKIALQRHLDLEKKEMDQMLDVGWQDNTVEIYRDEYMVLTEEEANEMCERYIKDNLWAFNAEFILNHCNNSEMDNWEWDAAKTALQEAQGRFAESLNGLVRALIYNMDEFVDDAICEDGRGHFLASYDGYENEEMVDGVTYYIYRLI